MAYSKDKLIFDNFDKYVIERPSFSNGLSENWLSLIQVIACPRMNGKLSPN